MWHCLLNLPSTSYDHCVNQCLFFSFLFVYKPPFPPKKNPAESHQKHQSHSINHSAQWLHHQQSNPPWYGVELLRCSPETSVGDPQRSHVATSSHKSGKFCCLQIWRYRSYTPFNERCGRFQGPRNPLPLGQITFAAKSHAQNLCSTNVSNISCVKWRRFLWETSSVSHPWHVCVLSGSTLFELKQLPEVDINSKSTSYRFLV